MRARRVGAVAVAPLVLASVAVLAMSAQAQAQEDAQRPTPAVAPAVELEGPRGGWRYHGLVEADGEARVAYPTPPIDRGGQRERSLIEGTLRGIDASRRAQTLAVNGNPLPLYSDAEGRFVRPYAFGAGSNSVAVLSADGEVLKRVQFYEANRSRTPARIRIVLGWDDPSAEVDLHVITPDGQHAYWARPVLQQGGGLDVDSVDGPGPEVFTLAAPLRGTYAVYVNYWGNLGDGGYNFVEGGNERDLITTRISLVFNENTVDERRESFLVPLRAIGDLQLIKAFQY
jgi:uncharacterized protein YfaP (DUF2135 family)